MTSQGHIERYPCKWVVTKWLGLEKAEPHLSRFLSCPRWSCTTCVQTVVSGHCCCRFMNIQVQVPFSFFGVRTGSIPSLEPALLSVLLKSENRKQNKLRSSHLPGRRDHVSARNENSRIIGSVWRNSKETIWHERHSQKAAWTHEVWFQRRCTWVTNCFHCRQIAIEINQFCQ